MTGRALHRVSRTLAKREAAGIVARRRQTVVILGPHAPATIAADLPEPNG